MFKVNLLIFSIVMYFSASFASALSSGIGGYMPSGECRGENGFKTGVVCEKREVYSSSASYNGKVLANASYLNEDGSSILIDVKIVFNDPNGYFKTFKSVPISGWASVCGMHRYCIWNEVKFNIDLQRVGGIENQYVGSFAYKTSFSGGAEYTELTQWVTFIPYGSSEKLVFDLR